jgi:ubiquinone/menaquinone biosynthesis C-methylase UbiE
MSQMKNKSNTLEWWHPSSDFFGKVYQKGDNSLCGYNATLNLTLNERTNKEIGFILKNLAPKDGSRILDCPCGYGRHSIELAKLGFNVIGLDFNSVFIKQSKSKSKALGLERKTKFIVGNMINPQFKDEEFDYILNLFTSFGFFMSDADNKKVLVNFYNSLKSKGKLLIHFDFNSNRITNGKYFKGDEHLSRDCVFDGKRYDLIVDEIYNEDTKRLEGKWILRNGELDTQNYSIRIYENKELESLLKDVGFIDVEFKDPDNNIFDLEESTETIIIATK